MIPIGSKFSDFPAANPSLPIDLIGLQGGINVRTTLVNPVCEDENGLIGVTTIECAVVVASNVECETINNATPITATNINTYIAAYLAAQPN